MNEKTLELERQIAHLSAEVTRLRRFTMIGFVHLRTFDAPAADESAFLPAEVAMLIE